MKKVIKNSNGITLIALVVTIVVLLILASIGINTLTGDGGIINQAKQGKDAAEISEEKEVIDISVVQAIDEDVTGDLSANILKTKLDKNTGEGKTEVIDGLETIVVRFVEKNRYYEIDKQGNTEGPKELTKDENAGDLSKGEKADGSEEKPYEINCIEDLVVFSIMVNGGNSELGISENKFGGKTVILTRTLNFQSIFSYNDYTTTKYGDLNEDGKIEDIRTELTKTEEGCIGFTPIGNEENSKRFGGTFDGRKNEIQNIYINTDRNAGLFGCAMFATIKNLGITGTITSPKGYAGGLVATGVTNYYNCYNKANITGKDTTGGIHGHVGWQAAIMDNCYNAGQVFSSDGACTGGLAGRYAGNIKNCYNLANVSSDGYAAGIVGQSVGNLNITNCYNTAKIESGGIRAGAIIAHVYSQTIVDNCYNIGNINVKNSYTNYSDALGIGGTTVTNCYNIGKITTKKGAVSFMITDQTIQNCYYYSNLATNGETIGEGTIDVAGKTGEEFIELLNSYTNEDGTYPDEWKTWKLGENGYPVFNE